jgi:hypothetical protein
MVPMSGRALTWEPRPPLSPVILECHQDADRFGVHHTGCVDPQLVEIIDELLAIVQSNRQDLNWQPEYDNERDLIEDLRDHAQRLRRGDSSRLPELRYVLLPTGALNEIAFSSGWGVSYVRLANKFDEICVGSPTPPPEPTL